MDEPRRPIPSVVEGLVSVVIPVFNRPLLLPEAVRSVLAQTYAEWELILVDDGSTDDTPEAIESLCREDSRARSIRRPNGGPGAARETGRAAARGEFIQYLDSDDLLLPRKFELQVAALRSAPEAALAYGRTQYRDASGNAILCTWKDPNQRVSTILPSFLVARWWETATPLYRASVCAEAGPWTSLRLEEDWEYDCRIGALRRTIVRVDEDVAIHRDHEHGRLSRGAALDAVRLAARAAAHQLVASHAHRAGMTADLPEMKHFARELFLLARQCGAAGLAAESQQLVARSLEIVQSGDVRLYRTIARMIGWRAAGRAAIWTDGFR